MLLAMTQNSAMSKELGLLIEKIKKQGVQSAVPVIIDVTPMNDANILLLLGLAQNSKT